LCVTYSVCVFCTQCVYMCHSQYVSLRVSLCAPSLPLIEALQKKGAKLRLFDPVSLPKMKKALLNHENIQFCLSEYLASHRADAIVLITEWKQFRFVNLDLIAKKMKGNAFFDGRNQYCASELTKKGFQYFGIGIPIRPRELLREIVSHADSRTNRRKTSTHR